MYNNENVVMVVVSKATQAIADIIPKPGSGKRIAIDRIYLNASGGANIATITAGANSVAVNLGSLGVFDEFNAEHAPNGIFPMANDTAFQLTLGSNSLVVGWVLYRIINN